MIPLRKTLEAERKRLQVPWNVLEQDYLLSWVLWGIHSVPELKNSLVFKGGTSLKKSYFGEYRFSEDLDFSTLDGAPVWDEMESAIKQACTNAQEELEEHIPDPIITCERYEEKQPHPEKQEAFTIKAQLPWHRAPQVRVMIEITHNETVVLPPIERPIIHNYSEEFTCSLLNYPLEEIIAEKLRAILQNIQKYHERGWTRSRARDYYDIWCILNHYRDEINFALIPDTLKKKCIGKGISHQSYKDFFNPIIIDQVKKDWDTWLKPLISALPACEIILDDLDQELAKII